MKDQLIFKYDNGKKYIYPAHSMVKSWRFNEDEEDEALFCQSMAVVAEKNGMNANDLMHLFPAMLRMLKSNGVWS